MSKHQSKQKCYEEIS